MIAAPGLGRWTAAALVVGGLAAMALVPHAPRAYVADDWFVMEAASGSTARDVADWLDPFSPGWYRPISLTYFAASWRAFGPSPRQHHALAFAIFGLTAAAVGVLGMRLYGEPWMGPAAAAAFGASSVHAEPVLWIAAANELLAGFWFVATLLAYARFVREGRTVWLLTTGVAFVLAIGSKETALALPVAMMAVHEWLPSRDEARAGDTNVPARRPWVPVRPWFAAALAAATLIAIRTRVDLPYHVSLAPAALLRNMAYAVAMILGAIPADARAILMADAHTGRMITVAAALAALAAFGGLAILSVRWRAWRDCRTCRPATAIAVAILVAGLLPTAPIVAERTSYVASIGAALLVAGMATRLLRVARRSGSRDVVLVAALFGTYLGAHATAGQVRADAWRRAGIASERLLSALAQEASASPAGARIVVVGLPDRIDSAYAFRNAFPAAAHLWPIDRAVEAVLESAATSGTATATRLDRIDSLISGRSMDHGPTIVLEVRMGPPISLVRRYPSTESPSR